MPRLKHLTKTALLGLYKYSGAAHVQETVERWAGRRLMSVLMFHRVTDAIPPDGLTVGTGRFEDVCRLLRRGYRVVPLTEVFDLARSGRDVPRRTVAITFDDTYRDNLFAARVLARHGLPATFFVPTAYVGTDHVYHWDRHLPRMPNLTWHDLQEMAALGFEFGSHTVTHVNLGRVPLDEGRRELTESKRVLEDRLRCRVRWLAYPYGGASDLRPELLPQLEELGYDGCVSAYGGFVHPGCDARVLPRTPVPAFPSVLNLDLHLSGCLNWVYALKRGLGWLRKHPASAQEGEPGMPLTVDG